MLSDNTGEEALQVVECSQCHQRFDTSFLLKSPLVRLGSSHVCTHCFQLKTQRRGMRPVQDETPTKRQRPTRQRKARNTEDPYELMSKAEEKDLELALRNSVATSVSEKYSLKDIPFAPTFYPTEEEFKQPLRYIKKIRPHASKSGICCVVPPESWTPPKAYEDESKYGKFSTKKQYIHRLQEAFGVGQGKKYTISEYRRMADKFKRDYFSKPRFGLGAGEKPSIDTMEEEFWRIVTQNNEEVEVEYGSDVDSADFGSGFPSKDAKGWNSDWNLNVLPTVPESVLSELSNITGVTVPWMYFGMIFSAFCWHNEDNYLYSTSYCHRGSPKIWYGVPSTHAEQLEQVMKEAVPQLFKDEPDLMMKLVTMISPQLLMANGVPVSKLVQKPGSFVITFPKAYHSGFNSGFNCNEAVNFATDDWFTIGRQATDRYRDFGRGSVFSHQQLLLQCALANRGQHDRDILVKALQAMRDEEKWLRETAWKAGITQCTQIPENSVIFECDICSHFCFLSSLRCSCNPNRHVCLEHGEYLCNCPSEMKSLSYRHTMGQISTFIRKYAVHQGSFANFPYALDSTGHLPRDNGEGGSSSSSSETMPSMRMRSKKQKRKSKMSIVSRPQKKKKSRYVVKDQVSRKFKTTPKSKKSASFIKPEKRKKFKSEKYKSEGRKIKLLGTPDATGFVKQIHSMQHVAKPMKKKKIKKESSRRISSSSRIPRTSSSSSSESQQSDVRSPVIVLSEDGGDWPSDGLPPPPTPPADMIRQIHAQHSKRQRDGADDSSQDFPHSPSPPKNNFSIMEFNEDD